MLVNLSSMRTLHIIFVPCLVGLLLKFTMAEGNQGESNQEGFHFVQDTSSRIYEEFFCKLFCSNVMCLWMKIILFVNDCINICESSSVNDCVKTTKLISINSQITFCISANNIYYCCTK
jgi:hypothetical protein